MTAKESQIVCGWVNGRLIPAARFMKQCREAFVDGELYVVEIQHQRDWIGHKAYFGKLSQLFRNWPEQYERQFDSAEHLRAWALIRTGHRVERQYVCATKAEAVRQAAVLRSEKPYTEISVNENVVVVWEALSQHSTAMGAKAFAKSSQDVVAFLCDLVGTTEEELTAQFKSTRVSPLLAGSDTRGVATTVRAPEALAEDRESEPSPPPGQAATIVYDFTKGGLP